MIPDFDQICLPVPLFTFWRRGKNLCIVKASTRQSVTIAWVILAIILIGGTAVGGSGLRRHSALERRVVTAEVALAERNVQIEQTADLAKRLRSALADARAELTSANRMLRTTQSLLQEAAVEVRTAQDTAEQRRREMAVLKTCLAGAAQALHYMAAADHYRALYVMTSVDRECREAQTLLAVTR